MAQKSPAKNSKDSSLNTLTRTAIDSSGVLGSFYDGHEDRVLGHIDIGNDEKLTESLETPQCIVHSNSKNQFSNHLQLINMTHELRLNVLLGFAPRTGIAAVIDHPHLINKDTRVLHYTFVHREERISDKAMEARKKSKPPTSAGATHLITNVTYGLDVVIVLQLSSDNDIAKRIDDVLQKICKLLTNDHNALQFDTDEDMLLETIIDAMAYSNIPYLTRSTTVREICSYLAENKNKLVNIPVMYTIQPTECMIPPNKKSEAKFILLSPKDNKKIEDYLINLSDTVTSFKQSLDGHIAKLLCGNLEKQLRDTQRRWQNLPKEYENVIKRVKQAISNIHSGQTDIRMLSQEVNNKYDTALNKLIVDMTQRVNDLETKGLLITSFQERRFRYCNAGENNVSKGDNKETLTRKLIEDTQLAKILCYNDTLNKNKQHQSTLNKQRDQLMKERETNQDLCLIYADFSYCSYELSNVMILTPSTEKKKKNRRKLKASVAAHKKKTPTRPVTETKNSSAKSSETEIPIPPFEPYSTSTTEEFINILLLGESGVGKSTFINAFVNYLTFESFDQAQSKEPVVLIPVSFTMTTGQNFDECTVTFGDFDSSKNEDFDHPGESVTQHCKSYEFDLNHDDGRKLRIIDTPGFGDTRGLDQDDLNMQHILEYITNLTHLNAVCFLLKPNASQLDKFFRICLTDLLDLLGPDARQNIIFCFTNARSTFYAPGDTAPLLKATLRSFSMSDIPFKRDNTFCFDNESFRYLVALQNSIKFDDEEKNEYEMSWSTSVNESNRLIDYICSDLDAYHLHDNRQSIKHAQIEIVHMIRPMLEAMRNILRNKILCNMDSPKKSIKLSLKAIHRPATICLTCKPYPIQIGNFWIVREIQHEFLKKCLVCPCSPDKHVSINYVLNYEYLNSPADYRESEMVNMVQKVCLAGVEFDCFLMHTAYTSKQDPFWMGLVQMITEETELHQHQKPNQLNTQLAKDLIELRYKYDERIEELKMKKKQQTELSTIYQWITTIREYPAMQEQLEAIKQSQQMMTEPYEASED